MPRDPATVSKNMKKIRSKDTSIEILLRKKLWAIEEAIEERTMHGCYIDSEISEM